MMMLRGTRPLLGAAKRVTILSPTASLPYSPVAGPTCPPLHRHGNTRFVPRTGRWGFSTKPPVLPNKRDAAYEKEVAQKKIEVHPELVSTESSVRHAFEASQATKDESRDVLEDVKNDLRTVKDTVALSSVPSQSYALGLAGTLPYLATSISTVYLSWDLKTTWPTDSNFINGFMVSHETATQWLQALEPVQIGYGAVLISFLGAIHWGLEYAEKSPSQKRTSFRYGIGLLAPAVAWPTMMLPIEWALTTQFLTFTGLYLADARATKRGWAPAWYATYRFILTAIVGATIFISLVARAKIDDKSPRVSTDDLKKIGLHAPQESYVNWARLEAEEKERIKKEEKEKEKAERKRKNEEEQKKQIEKKGGSTASKQNKSKEESEVSEESEGNSEEESANKGSNGKENENEKSKEGK